MKLIRPFAWASPLVRVFIPDATKTDGSGLTSVVYTSTGLVIDIIADNSNTAYHYQSATTATIQDITTPGTYSAPSASNCRFKAVDGTNFPGLYEIQFLSGVFDDAGCTSLIGKVSGVTNMVPTYFEVQLMAISTDAFERSIGTISYGTVGNSSTTTAVVVSSISPAITVDNQLNGGILKFAKDTTTTNLRNASARILSVTNSSQTINLVAADALPASPASGDTFVVL